MDSVGRNIATVSHAEGFGFPIHRELQVPVEDDVRGETGVGVVGVESVGAVLPNEAMREAFGFEFLAIVRFGFHLPGFDWRPEILSEVRRAHRRGGLAGRAWWDASAREYRLCDGDQFSFEPLRLRRGAVRHEARGLWRR